MILIFDNGYDYSDHELCFVDIGCVPVDEAVALCKLRYKRGHLAGTAEHIEWRSGDATTDLVDFTCSSIIEVDPDENLPDVPRDLLMSLYKREKRRVRELLEQSKGLEPWHSNVKRRDSLLEEVRARIETAT